MPDMPIRFVVAAAVQGVFGRGASQLEIVPLALTATTNLGIISLYTRDYHCKAAISGIKH